MGKKHEKTYKNMFVFNMFNTLSFYRPPKKNNVCFFPFAEPRSLRCSEVGPWPWNQGWFQKSPPTKSAEDGLGAFVKRLVFGGESKEAVMLKMFFSKRNFWDVDDVAANSENHGVQHFCLAERLFGQVLAIGFLRPLKWFVVTSWLWSCSVAPSVFL